MIHSGPHQVKIKESTRCILICSLQSFSKLIKVISRIQFHCGKTEVSVFFQDAYRALSAPEEYFPILATRSFHNTKAYFFKVRRISLQSAEMESCHRITNQPIMFLDPAHTQEERFMKDLSTRGQESWPHLGILSTARGD